MDLGEWLKGLGLGQYEAIFCEHEIDADVLPDLTEADLEKIGLPLGARKRLMKGIAGLASKEAPQSAGTPAPSPETSATARLQQMDLAERRPVTVMFCDLVGSTTISAALDAEDWRNLVSAYLDAASAAVTQMGGRVTKKLGDGLMALFGHPIAQENDSERAVRAALAIQRALPELNRKNAGSGRPELVARIGVESGAVVVDAAGEIFGDAPNIAARVQTVAEPSAVMVTARVQRQVAGLFVAEDCGVHALKGAPAPVTLYRIVRASGAGRRGGARAPTPLVGREEELDLLRRRWERARGGEGQLALIVGEPGIGKSRLIEEFRGRLGETPHTWVEWSSSQLLQNTPLHPFAEWGRQRFGAELPAEQRLADLEGTLKSIGLDPAEHAPLLAPIVDILLPASRASSLPPEELRRRQLAAIVAWVLAGARSQAVVLAIEDLHWADPTSLDLLQTLAERGRQAPLFVIATARPEFRPPWSLRSHHNVVSLSPLARAEVERMVGELAQRHALSKEVIDDLSERTGGVPLFVEEVTRLLLERGEEGGAHAIPPTLQQSLAARLDRLGPAREIAQIGAVLGRGFSDALLRAVAGIDDAALRSGLERLADADILFVEGAPPQATYRFKHALIQDAAYASLLKSRRQPLHRRAAEALCEAEAEPEAIAHHFTEAGLDDLAVEWWGKAGDQALRRSAFQEAISHLGRAIAMADKAAGGKMAGGSGHNLQLHVSYGNALIAARGYGAAETTEAFARARESVAGGQNAAERHAADYGLWVGSLLRGELSAMREHSTAFLSDVRANPESPEAGVAHRTAGITHWFAGEYVGAHDHLERALALFQAGRDDDLAFRFGQDAGVAARLFLGFTLWPLGGIDRAITLVDDAEARIAGLAHIGTRAYGRMHAALFALMRGDLSRAASNAAELAQLTREHDLLLWRAFGVFLEGLANAHQSITAGGGHEEMRRGVEGLREQNALIFDGLIRIALAEAEARAGDIDCALGTLDDALATSERTGHRAFEAEMHRARGDMLFKRDPANPSLAEAAFGRAIEVACGQGTRSFELRAALSLAKLYQSTSRPVEAHDVLVPALEGFSPTSEMPEIAEAQALLAALAETDEVKADAAQRQRRLKLQTGYAQAVAFSKGFLAEETKAAFERASELAGHDGGGRERFGAYYGRWIVNFTREQIADSLEIGREFFKAAESEGREMEAAAACRALGLSHFVAGDFRSARMRLEQSSRLHSPAHADESRRLFGFDPQAGAMVYLACVNLVCGELSTGRELIDAAVSRANELDHLPTRANTFLFKAIYEAMRGDPDATLAAGNALVAICRPTGLSLYLTCGEACVGWARARGGDLEGGTAAIRRSRAILTEQGGLAFAPFFAGLLAGLEAEAGRLDAASTLVEETLTKAAQTGSHFSDSVLMRLRGDILLKCNLANRVPIEQAFRSAIAIAKEQGARSHELLATLTLAKLYQSNARPVEAHAVLAPALEGFAPTSEMPEIAEAQALLEQLQGHRDIRVTAGAGSANS
jgi:class 3 adenylate cyclase/predicted ATPase